jgi:predicted nuclease of restriction endonuclease-like (RecB) superfamily
MTSDFKNEVALIKDAILRSQYRAASTVNQEQLSLYYGIGRYVSQNSREGFWNTGAIEQISKNLQKELPGLRGFSATNMKNMRIFYEEWQAFINRQLATDDLQNADIVMNKNRQLIADDLRVDENMLLLAICPSVTDEFNLAEFLQIGFTHHMEIIFKAKSLKARFFYIHECATRFWKVETLKDYLRADFYHKRGSMPNNFVLTIPNTQQLLRAVAAFKDEYLLDYINIEHIDEQDDEQDERVLEHSIVKNIKKFIMTFGNDFSFIGNQYRIEVDGEESFIDLLFFNRELNALVAIELKSGKFRPSYLGQLNFYLSALDEYVRKPHENQTIGIILCKEMKRTTVEFAVRDFMKPMGVATYKTSAELPEKLRKALPDMDELKKLL